MKKSITDYYKRTVELAGNATRAISKARADYERDSVLLKNAYEADMYGERGYREKLEEMKSARDAEVQAALSRILTVVDEYDAEMEELGKLDGDKIDDATMRLLNSGINLTHADYQELANKHADNAIMTRILKERYDANRPQEKGTGITIVQFGQSPESRSEVFSKFVKRFTMLLSMAHVRRYLGAESSRHRQTITILSPSSRLQRCSRLRERISAILTRISRLRR